MAYDFPFLKPFRYWVQKVLPTVYDDSLSYYELLEKVLHYLNETMCVVDMHSEAIKELEALITGDLGPLEELLDRWALMHWTDYDHPGDNSFALWFSTYNGSIEWEEYFSDYIDHNQADQEADPDVNDSSNSRSFVDVWYFPRTNIMIVKGVIKWKKDENNDTIEDKMVADDAFLRQVPPHLWDTYDPQDWPYPSGATTANEAMTKFYWIPLFHFKKPIGWGGSAPVSLGRLADFSVTYNYQNQWNMVTSYDGSGQAQTRAHANIAMQSKLPTAAIGQARLYGDGSFVFNRQLGSFWVGSYQDTGVTMEFEATFFIAPNGILSQYQGKQPDQICQEAIAWGRNHQGDFYYGAVGNARLDLVPDIEYPDNSGVWYPQADCSSILWLMIYRGAGIPIAATGPGKEMMLGEFVTFAKGGYWDSNTNEYIPGEPLNLGVMRAGDLIGYQPTSFGSIANIPVVYDDTTGEPVSGVGRWVTDGLYPPHNAGCRLEYTKLNSYFQNVVDILTRDFTHVAMYLGENRFIEISGNSVYSRLFPAGHQQAGDVSPVYNENNVYGNPTTYTNWKGEEKPYRLTLISENFDPHLGPYIFEGADIKGMDILNDDISDPANHIFPSNDRYVVRLFPDSVYWRSK